MMFRQALPLTTAAGSVVRATILARGCAWHRRGRNLHRRRAARERVPGDREGAYGGAAGRVGSDSRPRRKGWGGRTFHARDDNRDERAPRTEGSADGLRRDRRIRAPVAFAPPEPRASVSTVC